MKPFLNGQELKAFLDERVRMYNTPGFIKGDPVSIPHQYKQKEDIEIAGLLSAILSWGKRSSIVAAAERLTRLMEPSPYEFLRDADDEDYQRFSGFVYRTFQYTDALFFFQALKTIYGEHGGLEDVFSEGYWKEGSIAGAIRHFRNLMLESQHLKRSEKHLADPVAGSAAKRLNMYLRWMVRKDPSGVDFGIWNNIPTSALMCPLDVHSGRVARSLGLLQRTADDWKAVEELTGNLRKLDPADPVKYDYALFGLGVFEKQILWK